MLDAPKPVAIRRIDELKPYDKNAKIHTPEQVAKIAASISTFGFRGHIYITKDDVIINGHGRSLACKSLGFETIPCVVIDDMTEAQIQAFRLSDNKTNEGGYDADLLAEELYSLSMGGEVDMSLFFSEKDLSFVMEDMGQINLDGLSEDLESEVESIANSTQSSIDSEEGKLEPIEKVLGFKVVTPGQARSIRKLISFAEGQTGTKGSAALSDFIRDNLGL